MNGNPYYEEIRRTVNGEVTELRRKAEERAEEVDESDPELDGGENLRVDDVPGKFVPLGHKDDPDPEEMVTVEEVEQAAQETAWWVKSAIHHYEQSTESLPDLLANLSTLASEWSSEERSVSMTKEDDELDSIRTMVYGAASRAAYEERDKVQYILNNYE